MDSLLYSLKRIRRMLAICSAAMICFVLADIQAQAHKVNAFAYVEGDNVIVEGYFSAGAKARDSPVEVFDETGKKIHEGKTDQNGTYSFKLTELPAFSGGLKIAIDTGDGHKAEYTLSASDIPTTIKKDASTKKQPRKDKSEGEPPVKIAGSTHVIGQDAVTTSAMETLLDKKLEPIVRMIGRQERLLLEQKQGGPKTTDIVGGVGWIMGLFGLTAFFLARRRCGRGSFD